MPDFGCVLAVVFIVVVVVFVVVIVAGGVGALAIRTQTSNTVIPPSSNVKGKTLNARSEKKTCFENMKQTHLESHSKQTKESL